MVITTRTGGISKVWRKKPSILIKTLLIDGGYYTQEGGLNLQRPVSREHSTYLERSAVHSIRRTQIENIGSNSFFQLIEGDIEEVASSPSLPLSLDSLSGHDYLVAHFGSEFFGTRYDILPAPRIQNCTLVGRVDDVWHLWITGSSGGGASLSAFNYMLDRIDQDYTHSQNGQTTLQVQAETVDEFGIELLVGGQIIKPLTAEVSGFSNFGQSFRSRFEFRAPNLSGLQARLKSYGNHGQASYVTTYLHASPWCDIEVMPVPIIELAPTGRLHQYRASSRSSFSLKGESLKKHWYLTSNYNSTNEGWPPLSEKLNEDSDEIIVDLENTQGFFRYLVLGVEDSTGRDGVEQSWSSNSNDTRIPHLLSQVILDRSFTNNAVVDVHGSIISARKDKLNVKVQRRGAWAAFHDISDVWPGLLIQSTSGEDALYFVGIDRSDSQWKVWVHEGDEEWSFMANAPLETNDKFLAAAPLSGGGGAMVFVRSIDNINKVFFTSSEDFTTWSEPQPVVYESGGASIPVPSNDASLYEESLAGKGGLVYTDGALWLRSSNSGETWEPF